MKFNQRTVFRGEDGEIYKHLRPPRSSVKVWKDETDEGVEATHVRVPISSTSEDRDGDEFTEDGLEHMIEQLQSGDVPMFLDHGISPETGFQDYRALEAVGGWKDGEIEDGVAYGIGALDPDHEDAATLASRLENGIVPVGWSVGFIPHETESKGDDGDGERFLEHDLLEVSSVGIPSNPDGVSASIAQAAKSYARSRGVNVDAEELADSMTESLERAIEKQSEDELELVDDAISTFRSETDADEPTVADFLSWASDAKEEEELAVIAGVAEAYLETLDVDDEDVGLEELAQGEPLETLGEWVADQLEADDDGEDDEEGDGEDEEEEEAGEPDETDDEEGEGETITTDTVDAIVEGVGEAVGRQLEQHREALLEQLDVDPDETDGSDEDGEDDEEEEEGEGGDGEDEDDEDEETESVDSSTSSFAGEPRAIASFGSAGEERDADEDEETEKTGEPAGPTFNPGTNE